MQRAAGIVEDRSEELDEHTVCFTQFLDEFDGAPLLRGSDHVAVMRRRREWFDRLEVSTALWWIRSGHIPTLREAQERLAHLEERGPTRFAFTFKQRSADPGRGDTRLIESELGCPT